MKLFKYTALVLALLAGFTSCNDDDAYAPGEASDGVYFPTDDALEVNLDRNLDYFEVIVSPWPDGCRHLSAHRRRRPGSVHAPHKRNLCRR